MSPQQTIAHYHITSKLGEGGMGEVWRATDTKLGREVAIKILPETFAQDADRMARFAREAQVLASLNHPNIAAIYGVEERALVMELVEGESPKGPMAFDDAWLIASQIAAALEYAHDKGIVHRDLKPDNIKITPQGVVKLLDFGLAKALSDQKERSTNVEHSPTLTIGGTELGMILGTAAYMAPEQAKGKSLDKRADIWAFGVVLYELLTGERLFKGEDVADIIAQLLTKEPALDRVPVRARRLLRRCLEKDPRQRLRDIGEARFWLDDSTAVSAAAPRRFSYAWAIAGVLALALGGALWMLRPRPPELKPLRRLNVDLGPRAVAGVATTVAISPDGTRIVFPARGDDGKQRLAIRLLDQSNETLIAGTEGARDAFFSPDGQWIGFFADGKLKKISAQGGAPVTLSEALNPKGASWGVDGNIIASLATIGGLARVPDSGGAPEHFLRDDKQVSHRWPQVLPRARGILFTGTTSGTHQETAVIQVFVSQTSQIKRLLQNGYYGRFVATGKQGGYIVYVHEGTLFAAAFDLNRLELLGKPVPVLEEVAAEPVTGGGQFDVGPDGTLVYLTGKFVDVGTPVVSLDAEGKAQTLLPRGQYTTPRFSPDGSSLALAISSGSTREIHIFDLQRQIMHRVSFTQGVGGYPTWTPDGKHLTFSSNRNLEWIRADGALQAQPLIQGNAINTVPYSFSPDGRRLSYYEISPDTAADIWTVALDLTDPDHPKAGQPAPFLHTRFNELRGAFSPDGHWMAYESDESGSNQIYVQPFPGPGGKWQISSDGGRYGMWSRDGKQLFFESLDGHIMVANYTVKGDSFIPDRSRQWSPVQVRETGSLNLALHPDGKHFATFLAAVKSGEEKGNLHAVFLLNFVDELRRRVPVGGK